MRKIDQLFLTILIACCVLQSSFAQKSIKQSKQQTDFFYTQLNLNGGLLFLDNPTLMLSARNPYSNINFTYRGKNQRLLQRGYTRIFHLSDVKANVAFNYKNLVTIDGEKVPLVSLQIRDLWMKFNTKWDRTSIRIGHSALPYGHAPKMDIDNSFISALAGQDLGFNRDMGLFFRTPVCKRLDLEVAFTLGGSIPSTLFTYDFTSEYTSLIKPRFDYQNNWLTSFRIGNPTFYKNELGFFGAVGKVESTASINVQSHVFRLGGDWTYKYKERFRITNQIATAYTITQFDNAYAGVHQKVEMDYFWRQKWVISFANNLKYQSFELENAFSGTVVASISYALNIHTRIKCLAYNRYDITDQETQTGLFLQLVTGFGKRG